MSVLRIRPLSAPEPDRPRRPGRPELRVVDPDELSPAARRRKARILATLAALVVTGSLFGVTAFHTVLMADQGDIDALARRVAEQQARYERLRLEVAELESPDRIVREARDMGMVTPPTVVYLTPSPETSRQILGDGG